MTNVDRTMTYPNCGTCGHNTSGVLAGRCSAIVPTVTGSGPRDFTVAYCPCRCVDDPVVKAWLEGCHGAEPGEVTR